MSTNPELDQLLQDRFDITTPDFVTALKLLPTSRPWAASLTEDAPRRHCRFGRRGRHRTRGQRVASAAEAACG
mgnify:CR=1 FL=1